MQTRSAALLERDRMVAGLPRPGAGPEHLRRCGAEEPDPWQVRRKLVGTVERPPEPCAQVRILLGAHNSNMVPR
jgi:hypothetical protein